MENIRKRKGITVTDMVYIAVFSGIIAVCAWISVPAAVPFTMQTFAIFFAFEVLGGKRGTLAVLVYLLIGATGLPVFAGFSGGIGTLVTPSGGYLLGFLGSAAAMWGLERFSGRSIVRRFLIMLAGLLVCYVLGTVWFMIYYMNTTGPVGLLTVLGWCVLPFIVPDILKIVLALALGRKISRYASV